MYYGAQSIRRMVIPDAAASSKRLFNMKPQHILTYLGMLVGLLVVALVSGQIGDESQRVLFDTWAVPTGLIIVVAVWYFVSRRSDARVGEPAEGRHAVTREDPAAKPARALSVRPVLVLVSVAGALLVLSWACLIYLGSAGGEGRQGTALLLIRVVTTVVTTGTALLLSSLASAVPSQKAWAFRLGALSQVVLAFVGLIILPFVALTSWNDYVDFQAYSLKPGFLLLLLPIGAVVFCLTRDGGSKT